MTLPPKRPFLYFNTNVMQNSKIWFIKLHFKQFDWIWDKILELKAI